MSILSAYMHMYHLHEVPVEARRGCEIPLNWRLCKVVSHHVGARIQAQVCRSHLSGSLSSVLHSVGACKFTKEVELLRHII